MTTPRPDVRTSAVGDDRATTAAGLLRALTQQLVLLDTEPTDEDRVRLDEVIEHLRSAEGLLRDADLIPWHQRADASSSASRASSFSSVSPIRGVRNPLAPPLVLETPSDGAPLIGSARFGSSYEGPAGCVHGGFLAATFDGLLGHAVSQLGPGRSGFTGRLTVRYRTPAPLHTALRFRAEVTRDRGRMVVATATCVSEARPDDVLAEAEGLFVRPRRRP